MQVVNRANTKQYKKDWIRGVILIIAWILIFSLAKDLFQIRKGYDLIEDAKNRLIEEENKNIMLKDKLNLVMTEEYKEKIIREQLNMQKIGEVVAVLPKNTNLEIGGETGQNQNMMNWEKWWTLIK